jgi:hypothetical protein
MDRDQMTAMEGPCQDTRLPIEECHAEEARNYRREQGNHRRSSDGLHRRAVVPCVPSHPQVGLRFFLAEKIVHQVHAPAAQPEGHVLALRWRSF